MIGQLTADAASFLLSHPCNEVSQTDAMRPDLVGMRIYDAPLFAVGEADDPIFATYQNPEVVHADYMLPADWLPGARSVISFFVPFTERVKRANAVMSMRPADEWLHARCEGQEMLRALCLFVRDWFEGKGYAAVAPSCDPRMRMVDRFACNWSERHTGYACGLGTFGLSKGLLTAKGVAGRIGSVITSLAIPATERSYQDVYAHCTMCGKCAANCPVKCIDASRGVHQAKAHAPCSRFLDTIESMPPRGESQKIRYGCGKCQVGVPCQDGLPARGEKEC